MFKRGVVGRSGPGTGDIHLFVGEQCLLDVEHPTMVDEFDSIGALHGIDGQALRNEVNPSRAKLSRFRKWWVLCCDPDVEHDCPIIRVNELAP
jgi:hypothetical protein